VTDSITPPPELVQQWGHDANLSGVPHNDEHWAYEQHIATRAAQWGADQELEACAKRQALLFGDRPADELRAARRPKPPSLKEQALEALEQVDGYAIEQMNAYVIYDELKIHADTIRRALEALPE
jgi:hypothetical protein